MKVGDLITLSAYALQTTALWGYNPNGGAVKQTPVGMVREVRKNPHAQEWAAENDKIWYYISWCGKGPASRHGYATPYNVRSRQNYFLRRDLKFVSKA